MITEITLKDGRTFNYRGNPAHAFKAIADYLLCEYDETITENDVNSIAIFNR